jgi:hypothetical protein
MKTETFFDQQDSDHINVGIADSAIYLDCQSVSGWMYMGHKEAERFAKHILTLINNSDDTNQNGNNGTHAG